MDDVGGERFRGWVEAEREGLRRRAAMAYEQLLLECDARGDRATRLRHAERWAELRPLDEAAQRRVIQALDAAGRSAEARGRHAAVTARLRSELDAEPTAAFLRLGERLARAPAPPADRRIGSAALFTPDLVGRDGALGVLRAAWSEVRSGARVIVLVAGDPGIGKTRLCDQFLLEPSVSAGTAILRVQPARATAPAGGTVLRQLLAPLVLMPGVGAARPQALAEVAAAVPEFGIRFPDLPTAKGTPRRWPKGWPKCCPRWQPSGR